MSTAHDMTAMLRRHYLPENRPVAGIFAPEIGSPCGKRRADLIWMPTTIAGGRGLHGHEIKVSRADVLTELADATKADPWARYCSRWWLVVANPNLVAGLDIPEAWGVMAPPSGRRTRSMTIVKPAPALKPEEPSPGIARLAAWQLYNTQERISALTRDLAWAKNESDHHRREVDELRAGGAHRDNPHAQRVAGILSAAKERCRAEGIWGDVDDESVITAIVDYAATIDAAERIRIDLQHVVREVQRVVDPFRHSLDRLSRAERVAANLAKPQAVVA